MTNEVLITYHLLAVVALVAASSKIGKVGIGGFVFLFLFLSNLFVTKESVVFGLTITTCDVYTIGCVLSLNLIQEIYGKPTARRFLYMGVGFLLVFLIMAKFQMWYHPSVHSQIFSDAFDTILKNSPRIIISSLIVTVISDRIDLKWFQFLKNKFPKMGFPFRFVCSTMCSQLVDTLLFTFMGLYGIVENIWDCIMVAYLVKVVFILGSTALFLVIPKKFYKPVIIIE